MLSVSEKRDVCAYKEQYPGASQQNIANYFSVLWDKPISRRCVGDILSEKERWKNERRKSVKRLKGAKHQDVESTLIDWIGKMNAESRTVNDKIIKKRAKVIGQQMGVTDFVYSSGWLHRFKRRHGLIQNKKHGETTEVSVEVGRGCRQRLCDIVKEYNPKDIYSMNESALFYQVQPDTNVSDGPVKGCKKAEDKITLAFCTNANGSDKRTVTVVGKYKDLNPSVYVSHRHNADARMAAIEFGEWIKDFNEDMQKNKRSILLLVNNNTPFHKATNLSNVRLEFLPRSLQPLDAGIIKSFKTHYRRHEARKIAENTIQVSLNDALYLIKLAWDEVSSETIVNCWARTGLVKGVYYGQTEVYQIHELRPTMGDLPLTEAGIHLAAEEFLKVDGEGPVSSERTIEDIVRLTRNISGVADGESEDDDLRAVEVTSKETQISVERTRKFLNITRLLRV